jgi:hypothetical protein
MRTRTLLLLAGTFTVVTIAAAGVAAGGPSPPPPGARAARAATDESRASAVLRAWDHRRAQAWSRDDTAALAGLYASASPTGAQDVRDLRRWHDRGLRVVGLRQQVAVLRVRVETPRRLVVAVTDRTVDGIAVGHHRRTALPSSAWARHRVTLHRVHGRWVVAAVRAQPAR